MYIFFLIPFLLIASFGIYQDAFAQEVYRGDTYEDIDFGNGTHQWTGGLSPFLDTGFLDSKGRPIFAHYFLSEDANSITVQNGEASFVFDKNTCSAKIYNGGIIGDANNFIIGSDSYVPKSSVDGSGTWSVVTSVDNAPCVTQVIETADSIEVSGTKTSAAGIFKIRYVKQAGEPVKTILEATNLTALTDRRFGVTQTQSVPQIISFGGQQRDLANHVGETFDRTWLENNKANLFQFSQTLKFDVIDAWDNLESIKVNSVANGVASVSFNYLRNTPIILPNDTLVIDPTFGYQMGIEYYARMDGIVSASCGTGVDIDATELQADLFLRNSGSITDYSCHAGAWQFDITSLPNSVVTDSDLRYDVTAISSPYNCHFNPIQFKPSTLSNNPAGANTLFNDAINGTSYVANNSGCTTATNDKTLDLGTTADNDIEAQMAANWFAVGMEFATMTRDGSDRSTNFNDVELIVVYVTPNAITNLSYDEIGQTNVDLTWTQPNLNGLTFQNYRVNYTSPHGTPLTFLANTTNTYLNVTGLSPVTPYTFRVSVLADGVYNATGNKLNVTTTSFLALGDLDDPDVTNTDDFQIFFERDDIDATSLWLNVTYSDTYDLSCDVAYKIARINNTYSNLANVTVPPDQVESSFKFVNVTNDIISVRCYDEITGDESRYVITLTDFPFLEQIRDLRNGTFGTAFEFGAIDGVILVVVILSMIGFNRTNPAAGVIFMVITIGALSVLQIITYPIIMYPALALLVLWAVITTRKDD